MDIISIPLNWILQTFHNRHKITNEEIQAWREHGRTDEYLTLTEAKTIYPIFLKKVKIKKHLFWRYSLIWQKPLSIE